MPLPPWTRESTSLTPILWQYTICALPSLPQQNVDNRIRSCLTASSDSDIHFDYENGLTAITPLEMMKLQDIFPDFTLNQNGNYLNAREIRN
eukprot:scaffold350468_cov35-Attheya_sp.AAC.1